MKDVRRQGNVAFVRQNKPVVNRKIYELECLKKNFHMESDVQIRDRPTRVKDKEMSQLWGRRTKAEMRHIRKGEKDTKMRHQ
jgi:hypothetical protein